MLVIQALAAPVHEMVCVSGSTDKALDGVLYIEREGFMMGIEREGFTMRDLVLKHRQHQWWREQSSDSDFRLMRENYTLGLQSGIHWFMGDERIFSMSKAMAEERAREITGWEVLAAADDADALATVRNQVSGDGRDVPKASNDDAETVVGMSSAALVS